MSCKYTCNNIIPDTKIRDIDTLLINNKFGNHNPIIKSLHKYNRNFEHTFKNSLDFNSNKIEILKKQREKSSIKITEKLSNYTSINHLLNKKNFQDPETIKLNFKKLQYRVLEKKVELFNIINLLYLYNYYVTIRTVLIYEEELSDESDDTLLPKSLTSKITKLQKMIDTHILKFNQPKAHLNENCYPENTSNKNLLTEIQLLVRFINYYIVNIQRKNNE